MAIVDKKTSPGTLKCFSQEEAASRLHKQSPLLEGSGSWFTVSASIAYDYL